METAVKVETPDHVGDIADRVKRNYKSDNSGSTSRICHKSLLSEMAGGERGAMENQKYYMYVPKAHGKPQEILQRFIRQMKSRIKELSADLKPALALYEDYERGRTLEGGRQTKQSRT